jgi:quaternary ammonium compound-resistance protein SugE
MGWRYLPEWAKMGHTRCWKRHETAMNPSLSPSLAWIVLVAAGALEIVWSLSMKASEGFTRGLYTTITIVAAALSFWLLGLSLKALPVGTAYAVWTGIGAVGTAFLGIVLFNEPAGAGRVACIALIVVGIVGLKLTA